MRIKAVVGLALIAQLCLPYQLAWAHAAQSTPGSSSRSTSATSPGAASHAGPVNLDLSSTHASVSAAVVAATKLININVGGVLQSITNTSLLTPAEMVAAYQVANRGSQTLLLGSQGNAVGGSLSIGKMLAGSLSNLVVPQNVKVFDRASTLNLTGNLTNDGRLIIYSPTATGAVVNANNIFNQMGGVISAGSSAHPFSLTLNALGDINNAGTISSSANLNLNAGGSIRNALPAGVLSGSAPVMQAANNLSLYAGSGNITNAGVMAALQGNLNLATLATSNFNINNFGGTMQALNGAISVGNQSNTNAVNTAINGGDFLSQNLNVYSGTGTVDMNIGNVTGAINVFAGAAHVQADAQNLVLGQMQLSGDPTFFDSGNIIISEDLTFNGQNLAIVAGGNIYTATGADTLTTSSTTNGVPGGTITLVAGAAFTSNGASSSLPTGTNQGDTTSTITIPGGSTAGGNIDLAGTVSGSGVQILGINSSYMGSDGDGSGGNVIMVAYHGNTNAGSITLPTGTGPSLTDAAITTSGAQNVHATGQSGTVLLIAGATTGSGIVSGDINTFANCNGNCASPGGTITIATATPAFSGGSSVKILNGAILPSGATFIPGQTQPSSISTGNIQSGQDVNMTSGGTVTVGATNQNLSTFGSVSITAGNTVMINSNAGIGDNGVGDLTILTNANNGSILFDANAGGFIAGTASLTANGSGLITGPSASGSLGALTAFTFVLNSTSGAINMPFLGAQTPVTVSANTGGTVTLSGADTQEYIVSNSSSGGNFLLTTDSQGDTTVTNVSSTAGTVVIHAGSTATLSGISTSGSNAVTITTGGTATVGSITTASGAISVTSSGGLSVSPGASITTSAGTTATTVSLIASGALTVGNSTAGANISGTGLVKFQSGSGTLEIGPSSNISSSLAGITIQNMSTSAGNPNGTIQIDANAQISSGAQGSVVIFNGLTAPPSVTSATPANVTVTSGGSQIFFGTNGLTASAPTNTVSATGSGNAVVFDTGGQSASSITLGGGVNISANPSIVSSLDLTDPATTAKIIAFQGTNGVGGTLIVNGSGIAIGGTVILSPSNLSFQQGLSADDIPQNVTVTFSNFGSATVPITLASSSTVKTVTLGGTEQFTSTSGGSNGVLTITQNNASTPALSISNTGLLSSDGSLALTTTGGNVSSSGTISAGAGVLHVSVGGNITSTGTMTATTGLALQTTSGSNGSITLTGNLSAGNSSTALLSADGSGAITRTSGSISAGTVNFFSGTGAIGASTSAATYIATAAQTVSVNTTNASAYIANTGALTLNSSTLGNASTTLASLLLTATGTITTSGASSANVINLSTTSGSGGGIAITSTLTGTGTPSTTNNLISLSADGAGNITQTSGGLTAGTVALSTGTGGTGSIGAAGTGNAITTQTSNLTANTTGSGNVFVNNSGALTLGASSAGTTGGTFQLAETGNLTVSGAVTGNTVSLSTLSNGSITLQNTVGSSSGTLTLLSVNGGGNLTQTAGTIQGAHISLASGQGNLGTQAGVLQVNASTTVQAVVATTTGTGTVYLQQSGLGSLSGTSSSDGNFQFTTPATVNMTVSSIFSASGNITLQSGGTLNIGSSATITAGTTAGNSISLQSAGALTIGTSTSLTATQGNVTVIAGSGALTLGPNTSISAGATTASMGTVVIQNQSNSGTINIQTGAQITSKQVIGSEVEIFLGPTAPSPVSGTAPVYITQSTTNGGQIFYGNSGVFATTGGPATVTASGLTTVLFGGPQNSHAISLQSSVSINGSSTTSALASFDLSQKAVTTQIQTDITNGAITGTLNLTAAGAATTGTNLNILFPALLSGTLSALNIPTGVTINFDNFASPITVSTLSTSTTKNVIIGGTAQFVNVNSGTTSGSGLTVSSAQTTTPMLNITGSLTSAGPMTIQVTNNATTPTAATNVLTVTGTLTAAGALSIAGNGAITLSGTVNSPVSTSVTASRAGTSANSGNVILGKFGVAGSTNSISVAGTGTISVAAGGALVGDTFNFTDGTALTIANMTANTLSFNDTAAVTVTNATAVTLAASTSAAFSLTTTKGDITVSAPLTATGAVTLNANNTGVTNPTGITINGAISAVGLISMTATTGSITTTAGLTSTGTGGLTMNTTTGGVTIGAPVSTNGAININADTTNIANSSGIDINGALTTTGTAGTVDLTAHTGGVSVTAAINASKAVTLLASAATVSNISISSTGSITAGGTVTMTSNTGTTNGISVAGGVSSVGLLSMTANSGTMSVTGTDGLTSTAGITLNTSIGGITLGAPLSANGAVLVQADTTQTVGSSGIAVNNTLTTTGTAGAVTLTAYTGGISVTSDINANTTVSMSTPIQAQTTNISVTSTGSVTAGGAVTINAVTGTTTGGITLNGAVTGGGIVTLTAANGGIVVGASLGATGTAGTVNMTATTGTIPVVNSAISITAPVTSSGAINITSGAASTGGIAISSNGSVSAAKALTILASTGGITDNGALSTTGTATTSPLSLTATGVIAINAALNSAGTVTLQANATTTGGITTSAAMTARGAVSLIALADTTSGGITIGTGGITTTSGGITLTAYSGAMAINGALTTTTGAAASALVNLTTAKGGMSITAPVAANGAITIAVDNSSTAGSTGFANSGTGSVTSNSGLVSLINYVGNISQGADLTSATTMLVDSVSTTSAVTSTGGTMTAGTTLTLETPSFTAATPSIGSSTNSIQTSATTMFVNAGQGSAFVNNDGDVSITGFLAPAGTTLSATGTITNVGAISGKTISISSTGSTSGLIFKSTVGNTLTTTASISTAGTGSITTAGGSISATSLTLTTAGGSIGTFSALTVNPPAPVALLVVASNLTITAPNPGAPVVGVVTGSVFVNDVVGTGTTLNASSAGTSLQVTNTGNLTVAGAVTAPIVSLQSTLAMTLNAAVGASSGSVALQGSSITQSGTSSLLNVGTLSLISTGAIGASATPILTNAPTLTVNSPNTTVFVQDSASSLNFTTPTQVGPTTILSLINTTQNVYILNGSTSSLAIPSTPVSGANSLSVNALFIKLGSTATPLINIGGPSNLYNSVILTATNTITAANTAAGANYNIYANSFGFNSPSTASLTLNSGNQTGYVFYGGTTAPTPVVTMPNTIASGATFSARAVALVLSGNVGASTSTTFNTVSLTTSGAMTLNSGTVFAGTVNLTSTANSIGLSTASFNTNARTVNATAAGSVFLTNTGTGSSTPDVLAGSAGATFMATEAQGNLSVGTIAAPTVTLLATSSTGTLTFDSVGKAGGTTSLTAPGGISGNTALGTTVTFTSTGGSITGTGTSPSFIQTQATTVNVNALDNAFVNNSTAVKLNASASTTGTFDFTASGTITLGTAVGGSTVDLAVNSGVNGGIVIAGFVVGTANGSTTLGASGTGTITTTGTAVNVLGSTVNLSSTTGAIGSSATAPIRTNATTLTATTGGTASVFLNNGSAVSLGQSGAGGTFNLTNAGNLTTTGTLTAPTLLLTTTGNGAIGTSGAAFQTQASTITINSGTANAFISNANAMSLAASTAGSLTLTASGTITVSGALSASNATLQAANGSNGGIVLTGAVGLTTGDTGTKILSADGTGTITGAGIVYGSNLQLSSDTGNIGTATAAIKTSDAGQLTATTAGTGLVNISNALAGLTLNNSSSGGAFTLLSSGNLTVNNITTGTSSNLGLSTNSITVTTAGGNLLVSNGAQMLANGGNITLENSTVATGTVSLGTSSSNSGISLTARSSVTKFGQVNVVLGAVPATPVAGPTPGNVTAPPPANVFYGTKGITTTAGTTITLTTDASNKIVFNTGTAAPAAITVQAGTNITAKNIGYESNSMEATSDDAVIDTGDCDFNEEGNVVVQAY